MESLVSATDPVKKGQCDMWLQQSGEFGQDMPVYCGHCPYHEKLHEDTSKHVRPTPAALQIKVDSECTSSKIVV